MRELRAQLISALLVIVTLAAVVSVGINFQQQKQFRLPEDGVVWVDRTVGGRNVVEALDVTPDSQADRAGVRAGDILLRINGAAVERSIDVAQILIRLGAWSRADYATVRGGVESKSTVIIAERVPGPAVYYQYAVGAAYLFIGLFVYFRRGSAPKSTLFYLLCLVSYVFSCFHYTGKLNTFDKVIYWGNVVAGLLAPTLFLHFCLTFPEPRRKWQRGWRIAVIYLPAIALTALYAGVSSGMLRVAVPLTELRWLLDRVWLVMLSMIYLAGAAVVALRYRRAEDPVARQQLKWLRNGAVFGVVPFATFYVLPYAAGAVPGEGLSFAILSLMLIPITWAYAILRYRLMDVDVIFQQGYVYTLATLSVLGIFYALVMSLGKLDDLNPAALVILILVATFMFQPIRNWIQEMLDRYYFYGDRYDYRRTLEEFARELGAETDLDHMLEQVAERLARTLSLERVEFFLFDEESGVFRARGEREGLDLNFLLTKPDKPYLFFERPRRLLDVVSQNWPASVRETISRLDLTYYVACAVRGRTIAYMGVSRTRKGDFLTSDDLELLATLSGSVGIAIENARLYRTLQHKVEENERLKEFSENIVESINVGILAADLDDRVESWNTQIERLTGIARQSAVGRRLSELFPVELCEKFDQVRGEAGIHNIYKFPVRLNGHNGNGANGESRESVLNLAIAPLVSRDSRQIGRLIIFDDVTDHAELERRLVQADKLSSIGLLAAGVAHEVNTPLAVISTYAQMLAKQISGDDQKSKLLEKIAKQTFRASEIVNSLLNFSRTSTREFDEVDLNRMVRETLPLVEHQLDSARIELRLDLEDGLPAVRGNSNKLQQVLLNLVLNARDAMATGGVLRISSRCQDGRARILVADTGHGIAPDLLPRIFDPFFTTKPGRKGTGLGLSVTYGIVVEHGGSIDVESAPGAGTRFHLDFPLARKAVHA